MKCLNPQTPRSSTNPKENKCKENQTTTHHNQIANTKTKQKYCEVARVKDTCYIQRNKNLQPFWRSEFREAGEVSKTKPWWPRGAETSFQGQQGAGFTWGVTPSDLGRGKSTLSPVGGPSESLDEAFMEWDWQWGQAQVYQHKRYFGCESLLLELEDEEQEKETSLAGPWVIGDGATMMSLWKEEMEVWYVYFAEMAETRASPT